MRVKRQPLALRPRTDTCRTRLRFTVHLAWRSRAVTRRVVVTPVRLGQRDDVVAQRLLGIRPARHLAMRRSMLAEHCTSSDNLGHLAGEISGVLVSFGVLGLGGEFVVKQASMLDGLAFDAGAFGEDGLSET